MTSTEKSSSLPEPVPVSARLQRLPLQQRALDCCWRPGAPANWPRLLLSLWNMAPQPFTQSTLTFVTTAPSRTLSTPCHPEWAEIDVLVNNAGLSRGLEKLYVGKIEDWDEMIDTNVKGLLYVTRAVVPGMVVRGRGHVINLGSTAGSLPYPNGAVYCASKAAEHSINDGLRQDLLGTPVRVTSIEPGMVQTDFSLVRFHGDEERAAKVYKGVTPLTPEDVADAILWAATRPAACKHSAGCAYHDRPGQLTAL